MSISRFIPFAQRAIAGDLIAKMADVVFGNQESSDFAEAFVPANFRIPWPKGRNFSSFCQGGVRLLWVVYSDSSRMQPAGFIIINDLPHHNALGFGVGRAFAGRGLIKRAWCEIICSEDSDNIRWPLNAYTSMRNLHAIRLLEVMGFKRVSELSFGAEPSFRYSLSSRIEPLR